MLCEQNKMKPYFSFEKTWDILAFAAKKHINMYKPDTNLNLHYIVYVKNSVNGMIQIGKVGEWVYRFCFREAVASRRETMPLPAICKFMRFLGLLLDVVQRKGIIMSITGCFYS